MLRRNDSGMAGGGDRDRLVHAPGQHLGQRLAGLQLQMPAEAADVRHVYRAYAVLVDDPAAVCRHLAGRGIATRVYYIPLLHEQPAYRALGYRRGDFPVAEWVADRTICLPIFPEMTEAQIDEVVDALQECVPARTTS